MERWPSILIFWVFVSWENSQTKPVGDLSWSSVGFHHGKRKTKQNKNKTCKLVPLLRVKIVQFLNRVGSSLQQTWGKRWSSWKSTWKVLFFWLFFGFFFKVNQPQSPDVENTKLKSPLVGGSVFQDLLAPGSVAAFYAPGREGRDGIFYLIFLPSLGGEGTPPLWLCFSSETTATTPSKPTQSPADDSSWCVSLKTPTFPLDWSEIPSVFQLNFPPKASKSQPFYPPPVAFLREQQMGLWTFLQLLSLLPLILSPPELFCDQLCPFFCLFCTELFFLSFWGGEKFGFFLVFFFQAVPTRCSPFSGGIPLEFQRLCTLPREHCWGFQL